jgi:adenosylcobinamide-phosphate synthase
VIAVCLTLLLEWTVQEPPRRLHPVAWFGRLVSHVERPWRRPRAVGAAVAVAFPLLAAAVAGVLVAGTARVSPLGGAVVAGGILFVTTSLRMLLAAARGVVAATAESPAEARERLPALAGRNPAELSAGQLRSAAVESASENLADGLVAPLSAFVALSPLGLAAAAGAAGWVKAVNTLDSMLGYRSKPVGTASARLDDLVMYLPARLSAGLIAVAAAAPRQIATARTGAHEPTSPNAGWPMCTLAVTLGVRLEKPDTYVLNREATLPGRAEAEAGIRIVGRAGLLAYGLAALAGVMLWL